MILVGQYDSPFVRRVAVSMHHYRVPYERRVLSVYGDFDEMRGIHPLGKVPVLQLDDGELIYDSSLILDYLDERAGPEAALVPADGPKRRAVQRLVAIGLGLAEKSVEYRAETFRRAADKQEPELATRLALQIEAALGWLEPRAEKTWLHGDRPTQADITAAVAVTNLLGKIPAFMPAGRYPNLEALTDRAEALDCFQAAPFSEG